MSWFLSGESIDHLGGEGGRGGGGEEGGGEGLSCMFVKTFFPACGKKTTETVFHIKRRRHAVVTYALLARSGISHLTSPGRQSNLN